MLNTRRWPLAQSAITLMDMTLGVSMMPVVGVILDAYRIRGAEA